MDRGKRVKFTNNFLSLYVDRALLPNPYFHKKTSRYRKSYYKITQVIKTTCREVAMSSDGVMRLNYLRSYYQSQVIGNTSDVVRELQAIKNETKIANDEKVREDNPISNITNSPYLLDQIFFRKDAVYNSIQETEWKEVKSDSKIKTEIAEEYSRNIQKRLNIV